MTSISKELQTLVEDLQNAERDHALLVDFRKRGGDYRLSVKVESQQPDVIEAVNRVFEAEIHPAGLMNAIIKGSERRMAASRKNLLDTAMAIGIQEA